MSHRVGRWAFALAVGLLVAFMSYRWITDPHSRAKRQVEEAVVMATRQQLHDTLSIGNLELVDPLARDRKVGKGYVYRAGDGWQVSGFYRRDEDDRWHPYLVTLDANRVATHVKVQDAQLVEPARQNALLEALP